MANDFAVFTAGHSSSPADPQSRFRSIGRLPNHRVLAELLQLNQQRSRVEAELLLFLGELDQRQLYREHAVASAFEFCVARLGYSEEVAWKRVGAARLMRRFPRIYGLLTDGRVHLTALMLLKPHLTDESHQEWLSIACGKSKRQLEKLLAARFPRPDLPASIRKLPEPRPSQRLICPPAPLGDRTDNGSSDGPPPRQATIAQDTPASPARVDVGEASAAVTPSATTLPTGVPTAVPTAAPTAPGPAAARLTPLSTNTYRITFTASDGLKQKLDRAGELLSHSINPSDLPALIERALDQLLEREEKRRFGAPRRPLQTAQHESCQEHLSARALEQDPDPEHAGIGQTSRLENSLVPKPKRRHRPPVAVQRTVFERDGGQCTYVDCSGQRCNQRHYLEYDHIDAHAVGGEESVSNLRLLCRAHNQLEAERWFGRERVKRAIERAGRRPQETNPAGH